MMIGYYHSVLASIQLWRRHVLVDELLHAAACDSPVTFTAKPPESERVPTPFIKMSNVSHRRPYPYRVLTTMPSIYDSQTGCKGRCLPVRPKKSLTTIHPLQPPLLLS